ncbi:adrenoceptor beta 2, surface b [Austrofundulus limnaeus]|uniref:Beta-2 adrenergic receptor n=1 Tax=Austrofundulus limnaeus TaxID=52670 RepID=A0A2I4BZD9_AUSLI|nr:PREDICTED: beta-2 adrenergic receptor-like [Austrofundulus limnaeus]XP_013873114.1 PREDICTED: beta-2 adrenergic receptor-like [Austrofundulus limnaeus]
MADVTTVSPNQTSINITQGTSEHSDTELVLIGAAMALLIVAIVFGNVMVITAILRFQRLQTITNLFIASLAVADLIMGVVVVPFSSSNILLNSWKFGNVMCNFWTATDILCVTASIETLCVIAMDRYLAIMSPLRYPTLLTRFRAIIVVLAVWTVASLISFLPIFLNIWVKEDPRADACLKDENCCEFHTNPQYAVTSSVVSFYLPLFLMIFLYSRVFQEAQKQLEKIRGRERHLYNLHNSAQRTSPDDSPALNKHRARSDVEEPAGEDSLNMQQPDDREEGKNKTRTQKGGGKQSTTKRLKFCLKEQKALKTLGIIMGTFTFCWLPFFILNIIVSLMDIGDNKVLEILNWIGYSNSAFNPLIYCRSPDFRHAFQEILHLRGKGGRWRRRAACGWCDVKNHFSKSLHRQTGSSDVDSARALDSRQTSRWKDTLESSVQDSSPTLALQTTDSEQVLDVAPGSLSSWQTKSSSSKTCKEDLASIA